MYQWCGGPCFAGAVILRGGYLLQISKWGKHKSLLISLVLYGGQI
jgi:hypothetical protein